MAEQNLVWKDTVLVRTGETVDVLLHVTSPRVWMAHCHKAVVFPSRRVGARSARHQRRALREAGFDADAARVRDPEVVERYEQ